MYKTENERSEEMGCTEEEERDVCNCVCVSRGCQWCAGVCLSATPDVKMAFAICHLNSKLQGIYLR